MLSVIVVAAAMVLREPTPSPLLLVGIEIVIMVACSVVFVPLKNERWRMRVRQLRELRQTQPSANTILSTMALYDWILKELTLASISQENDGYE